MRLLLIPAVLFLTACQNTAPVDAVGSDAWMARVDRVLSVSDGQGHGPDFGSQEWCDVVHFKLHGQHAAERVPCDQEWMRTVDAQLPRQ